MVLASLFLSAGSGTVSTPRKNIPGKLYRDETREYLPGTERLTWQGDLSVKMMDGAHKMIEDQNQRIPSQTGRILASRFQFPGSL